ncbi:RimK family alpha-L-glutamate ligase [Chthonobacter rhizosphaerae]|uniref:RimK family alpha-L-glutamate ligase n=1 Tax=Chthonobacter rhizosphaerae TaxID=2735553 RepID=UPI0015EF7593|nr:RimK family alpha-L-glutamate ligase [Chthonobacter rhizosphaerae]
MPRSPDVSPGRVVVFTDQADWHLKRVRSALHAAGVEPVVSSLRQVVFDVGAREPLAIPGLNGRLPRAVLVRGIAAGSFEAITLRLGVLHALADAGVTVWNGARAIEKCVDKAATSVALVRAGLPTPRTLVTESRGRALDFLAAEIGFGNQVVLKPLFGSQGKGLRLLARIRDLPGEDDVFGVYYLQRFIPARDGRFKDIRAFVSGGRIVAAMVRVGATWITNVHQGATPEPIRLDSASERMALAAAAAVGADFAGVDLIEAPDGGMMVLEVNSMPAWRGLQKVAGCDVAAAVVSDFLAAAGLVPAAPQLVSS